MSLEERQLAVQHTGPQAFAQNIACPKFSHPRLSPRDVSSPIESSRTFFPVEEHGELLAGVRQEGGGAEGHPVQPGFYALP